MTQSTSIPVLDGRRILLGVCGSIAAYKSVELASRLTQAGSLVDVLLTTSAERFVSRLTFQSVTGRKAYSDADLWGDAGHVLHIGLSEQADLFMIAPATANTLAKLAGGAADNLLTITALAVRCPLLIAPAMDAGMFDHPATRENLSRLEQRGAQVIGPQEGRMASGLYGKGRLVEAEGLMGAIRHTVSRGGSLHGRKVVVTAGGTREAIDAVRFITNRSSGKQGFALAQAALDLGAEVVLISGPTWLPTPVGATRLDVCTAEEMTTAVLQSIELCDILIMAAAVADFRPAEPSATKLPRDAGLPELRLEPTRDILQAVAERRRQSERPYIVVGFAAESHNVIERARAKLEAKGLALIVANDITAIDAGFDVDTNRAVLIDAKGGVEELPLMSKGDLAIRILDRLRGMIDRVIGPFSDGA
jgi:phosphopantothenoylcysteine decarboxylase / phosphopantothenate---cysteine ligase